MAVGLTCACWDLVLVIRSPFKKKDFCVSGHMLGPTCRIYVISSVSNKHCRVRRKHGRVCLHLHYGIQKNGQKTWSFSLGLLNEGINTNLSMSFFIWNNRSILWKRPCSCQRWYFQSSVPLCPAHTLVRASVLKFSLKECLGFQNKLGSFFPISSISLTLSEEISLQVRFIQHHCNIYTFPFGK